MPESLKFESIGWGVTERCNLACPHCYSSVKKSSSDELTTQECINIIDILHTVGLKNIGWTGGEPLLRRDLEDIIRYADERYGIASGITSNGIPLTRRRVDKLKEVGVRSLQISLDGSTPDRNRAIRGATEKDFEKVIAGIRYSQEAGLPVHLAMVVSRDTLDDVMSYIGMARDLGVKSVRFCGFVPVGYGAIDEVNQRMAIGDRLSDLAALVDEILAIGSPRVLIDPPFGPLPPTYRFHQCIAGKAFFYISGNGDVFPCTSLLDERFRVGNVRQRDILDILADPKMTEMASFDYNQIHGHCRECYYFQVCRGACRGTTYAHTGDLKASFPVCLYRGS